MQPWSPWKRVSRAIRNPWPVPSCWSRLCWKKANPTRHAPWLRKSVARHPDSPLMLMALGLVHSAQGNRAEAIKTFRSILQCHPKWIHTKILLAVGLSLNGENREAFHLLEEVQQSHPNLPGVHLMPGRFSMPRAMPW